MKTLFLSIPMLVYLVGVSTARGQVYGEPTAQTGGITVNSLGELKAKPDVIELKVHVNANAELTDDALVKHRDAKQAIIKAYEKLKLENLKIDEQSLAVRTGNAKEVMQAMMNGMVTNTANSRMQIDVASILRIRLSGISKMSDEEALKIVGKLLDTAQDSGGRLGPTNEEIQMQRYYGGMRGMNTPMVRFIVTGADKVREEAYQKAVADARQRAERLATLHNVKLGSVLAVNETFVSGDNPAVNVNNNYYYQMQMGMGGDGDSRGEVPSETLSEVPFQVRMTVRFAISPAAAVATAEKPKP